MINGIILASGFSKRMGKNKLLEKVEGKCLIQYIVESVLESEIDNIVVVYRDKSLEDVLKNYKGIKLVFNKHAENGQSEALKTGIQGAGKDGEYIFFVGDQPLISVETINLLIKKYRTNLSDIIVSMYDNKRGNPVLFSNKMKSELLQLEGDEGGRQILKNNEQKIDYINVENLIEGFDVDCPEDLEYIRSFMTKSKTI